MCRDYYTIHTHTHYSSSLLLLLLADSLVDETVFFFPLPLPLPRVVPTPLAALESEPFLELSLGLFGVGDPSGLLGLSVILATTFLNLLLLITGAVGREGAK